MDGYIRCQVSHGTTSINQILQADLRSGHDLEFVTVSRLFDTIKDIKGEKNKCYQSCRLSGISVKLTLIPVNHASRACKKKKSCISAVMPSPASRSITRQPAKFWAISCHAKTVCHPRYHGNWQTTNKSPVRTEWRLIIMYSHIDEDLSLEYGHWRWTQFSLLGRINISLFQVSK